MVASFAHLGTLRVIVLAVCRTLFARLSTSTALRRTIVSSLSRGRNNGHNSEATSQQQIIQHSEFLIRRKMKTNELGKPVAFQFRQQQRRGCNERGGGQSTGKQASSWPQSSCSTIWPVRGNGDKATVSTSLNGMFPHWHSLRSVGAPSFPQSSSAHAGQQS
jgi:hypothetical protein